MRFDSGRILQRVPQKRAPRPSRTRTRPSPRTRGGRRRRPAPGRVADSPPSGGATPDATARKSRADPPPLKPAEAAGHARGAAAENEGNVDSAADRDDRARRAPSPQGDDLLAVAERERPTRRRSERAADDGKVESPSATSAGPSNQISSPAAPSAFPTSRFATRSASSSTAPAAGTPYAPSRGGRDPGPSSGGRARERGARASRRQSGTSRGRPARRETEDRPGGRRAGAASVPSRFQPPGVAAGIDPDVRPREGDAARGHGYARRAAPRKVELRGEGRTDRRSPARSRGTRP